nr:hypothetical protein [Phycisphaerae bacterium]NIS53022.1 hypothetical protein [Phycisphaerae bacterium]NIX00494.1 hypothetical protein [Phycisphaerae bacterium]NIX29432.1 hypothetical protein [Phycisphaerae bacterium]
MAKHSVNVLIKARDEASKKFGIIGVSSKVMGTALKRTAKSIKWSFTRAFAGISASAKLAFSGISAMARRALNTIRTTIRRITLAIAAAFTYSTYAAMKQQAAEVELAAALKMAGTYSDDLMQKLKQQAAEIQKNTVYGDEYVLMLMRQAKTLGVNEDKLADAAKAAIALYEGFGGGRGKPEIFMRYYVDAIRGTSKSLDTYIGELRKAQSEEERQIILQKNIAKGWDVAKSKTDHAAGSLKQMKNAIGDAAEAFGRRFLADITKTAKAITRWANENQDKISYFAERVHSYVTLIKDIFKAYIDFMKADWKEGFRKTLDSGLVIFKAFGRSLLVLVKKVANDFANILIQAPRRAFAQWRYYRKTYKEILPEIIADIEERERKAISEGRVKFPTTPRGGLIPLHGPTYQEAIKEKYREEIERRAREYATRKTALVTERGVFEEKYPALVTKSWGKVGEEIKAINKEALDKIKNIMPGFAKDVEKAFAENEKRLRELAGKRYKAPPEPGEAPPPKKEEPQTAFGSLIQQLRAREARLLTAAPGAKYDWAKQTAKNTNRGIGQRERLINLAKSIRETLKTAPEKE